MSPTDQFITGFNLALAETGLSKRQVCLKAGVNAVTLRRFMRHRTDIKLTTLQKLCEDGLGMSFHRVYHLGGE